MTDIYIKLNTIFVNKYFNKFRNINIDIMSDRLIIFKLYDSNGKCVLSINFYKHKFGLNYIDYTSFKTYNLDDFEFNENHELVYSEHNLKYLDIVIESYEA